MNTIRSATAALAVLAAGVGTVAALTATDAASAGTASAGSGTRSTTFTLRSHQGTDTNIDLGQTGFSAGDQDYFTGTLTRGAKHVGRLVGNCATARVGASTADQLCEFTLHLGQAQITAIGSVSSTQSGPGTFVLPIVGGTGRYDSATGQIAVTATNGKTFPIAVSLH
jgi:hypothetical protein